MKDLVDKYGVDVCVLEPLKYLPADGTACYISEFRVLQETLKRIYDWEEVRELVKNAVASKLINLKEEIDECNDDIVTLTTI